MPERQRITQHQPEVVNTYTEKQNKVRGMDLKETKQGGTRFKLDINEYKAKDSTESYTQS